MLDSRQLQRHRRALESGDEPARREAVQTLSRYATPEWAQLPEPALYSLVTSLRRQLVRAHGDAKAVPHFQQHVVALLGKMGPCSEAAVPDLIPFLSAEMPYGVREAAVKALASIGPAARTAVPHLLEMLTPDCRVTLAAWVARALGEIGRCDQKVRQALLNLWSMPISLENGGQHVAHALCRLRIDAPGLIDSLVKVVLGHARASDRVAAVQSLSWCRKEARGVVAALLVAAHDDNEEVQRAANEALTRVGVSQTKAILICCEQLSVCPHAAIALRKSGANAVKGLIAALGSREAAMREQAAKTLGAMGELAAKSAPALSSVLRDKDSSVRLAAAKALWSVSKQPEGVVPVLTDFLEGKGHPAHESEDERRRFLQTVIEALHRIGPHAHAAVPALKSLSRDANRLIRESASRALSVIQPAGK